MIEKIDRNVLQIYNRLASAGFEVYFVGGCVRNLLLGTEPKDWDLTTNALPEEVQAVFPDSFYDNLFGTVGVPLETPETKHPGIVEITTYRTESSYENHRKPVSVTWGKTIAEDLSRRDFTINAIALSINKNSKDGYDMIDPFEGKKDVELKTIRAVGDPNERFKEDALRLMRAIRFATQLSFSIEDKTMKALTNDAALIQHISGERIRDELLRILSSEHAYEGIMLLDATKLLDLVLPELTTGKDVSQTRPGRHHTTDVFTHNVLSLKHCPSTDPIVRLATLLHDSGKPVVKSTDENGYVIFYNHEVAGARIMREVADRLRLSRKQKEKTVTLIRWHMFTVDEHITDSAIRRFIRRVGVDNVKDMMDLRIGDRLGGGTQVAESWRLKKFKERVTSELNPPFSINDLAIDGNDIMTELNITPGKQIGIILKTLFEEVDEDLSKNTKAYLIPRIHEISKTLE